MFCIWNNGGIVDTPKVGLSKVIDAMNSHYNTLDDFCSEMSCSNNLKSSLQGITFNLANKNCCLLFWHSGLLVLHFPVLQFPVLHFQRTQSMKQNVSASTWLLIFFILCDCCILDSIYGEVGRVKPLLTNTSLQLTQPFIDAPQNVVLSYLCYIVASTANINSRLYLRKRWSFDPNRKSYCSSNGCTDVAIYITIYILHRRSTRHA